MGAENEQDMSMEAILASIRQIMAADNDPQTAGAAVNKEATGSGGNQKPDSIHMHSSASDTTLLSADTIDAPSARSMSGTCSESAMPNVDNNNHDILELTQEIQKDGSIVALSSQGEGADDGDDEAGGRTEDYDAALEELVTLLKKDAPITRVSAESSEMPSTSGTKCMNSSGEQSALEDENHGNAQRSSIISHTVAKAIDQSLSTLNQLESETENNQILHPPDTRTSANATLEDMMILAAQPMLKEWIATHLPKIVHDIIQKEIRQIIEKKFR